MKLFRQLFLISLYLISYDIVEAQINQDSSQFRIKNTTAYIAEFFTTNSERQEYLFQPLGLFINSTAAQFKKHHNFRIDAMLSYGAEPTANITRDLQTFSNIEAGFLFGIYQFYYQYAKDNFWIKIGHQDINSDFLIPDYGLTFSHSSFGIDPVATINMPAPTYPVSAMSITSQIRFNNHYTLRLGVFDGQFEEPNGDFLGLKTKLDKDEGYIFLAEHQFSIFNNRWIAKLGNYYHSGLFYDYESNDTTRGQLSFYQINDIALLRKGKKEIGLFTQFNASSVKVSQLKYYIGSGLLIRNMLNLKAENEMGLALGFVRVNNQYEEVEEQYAAVYEGVVEAQFKHRVLPWLDLHYYFQYLGKRESRVKEKNPLVAAIRLYINTEKFKNDN